MAMIPELKDWKALLEERLSKTTHSEEDVLGILHLCQDFVLEIQPVGQWLGEQQGFVNQMQRIFNEIYFMRFNKQPPPRPTETPVKEVVLNSPEARKQAIRQVALSITQPGDGVSDEAVLEELKRQGMKIDLANPTATISTVLRGFRPQFEKAEGKRGVFIRRE
jgi:hypothetical protein